MERTSDLQTWVEDVDLDRKLSRQQINHLERRVTELERQNKRLIALLEQSLGYTRGYVEEWMRKGTEQ